MRWTPVTLNDRDGPTVLEVEGVGVVRLMKRVGGTWFAVLDYHLGYERSRRRDCTSFEAGQRGAELWAERHAARLADEATGIPARRTRLPCIGEQPLAPSDQPTVTVEDYFAQQAEEHERIAASIVIRPRRRRRR